MTMSTETYNEYRVEISTRGGEWQPKGPDPVRSLEKAQDWLARAEAQAASAHTLNPVNVIECRLVTRTVTTTPWEPIE